MKKNREESRGKLSVYIQWRRTRKVEIYITPFILNLGITRRWVVSLTPRPIYPQENYRYPLNNRICPYRDTKPVPSSPCNSCYTNYAIPAAKEEGWNMCKRRKEDTNLCSIYRSNLHTSQNASCRPDKSSSCVQLSPCSCGNFSGTIDMHVVYTTRVRRWFSILLY